MSLSSCFSSSFRAGISHYKSFPEQKRNNCGWVVGGERGWKLAKVAVRVSSFRVQRRSVGRDGCFTNRINNISSGSSSSSFAVVVCHQAGESMMPVSSRELSWFCCSTRKWKDTLCLGLIRKLGGISTGIRCIVLTVYGWANRSICGRWKLFTLCNFKLKNRLCRKNKLKS